MVSGNLTRVESEILKACERAGRSRDELLLVAVSKQQPVETIMEAYQAGCRHFGENRVQELVEKYEQMPKDINWHLIGHLQRNKVKYVIDKVYMIHSVDSLRLAVEISREAVKRNLTVKILIEVNVAGEESKYGIRTAEAPGLIRAIASLPGLQIEGLMTIAPFVDEPEENRSHFVNLHQLYVDIISKNVDNTNMKELSMGMTGDYIVAIEEGATMVRIGTGIFQY